MPKYKHIVEVSNDEKRLKRIMQELVAKGESVIDDTGDEWHGTMRKFGIRTKKLVKKDLIEPVWIQRDDSNIVKKRMIRVPKGVNVLEINGNKRDFFHFKRRKIV